MAALTFVLDQNFGASMLQMLRSAKVAPIDQITSFGEMGFSPEAADEDWMPKLGTQGRHAVITRDGAILRASTRLEAWKHPGLTLLLLDGRWGQLPIRELSRAMLYWWPLMVRQAEASKRGEAWTVPRGVPPPGKEIRVVNSS